jgi:Holliday junction DNA helicase RuvA
MYNYILGMVTDIEGTYVVVEAGGIGYQVYTPNPYSFDLNTTYKVYIYQYIREDENSLYGFKSKEEKEMFLKLISVKGLGPKMALPILATGSISGIMDAIERENILYLKKFPKIGDKVAKQMILDLKGKILISGVEASNSTSSYEELIEVLKGLGYKEKEIKAVVVKVNQELSLEEQVKEALKLLLK